MDLRINNILLYVQYIQSVVRYDQWPNNMIQFKTAVKLPTDAMVGKSQKWLTLNPLVMKNTNRLGDCIDSMFSTNSASHTLWALL